MPTVLITGASRGIGLEFARQYAADGWSVLAACRDPGRADKLRSLGGAVEILGMNVADDASVRHAAEGLAGRPIDLLINNAGVGSDGHGRHFSSGVTAIDNTDPIEWLQLLNTNTIGPFRVTASLVPNLAAGGQKKIAMISSGMGSIGTVSGGAYAYRSSKAALNMVAATLARDLEAKGMIVVTCTPGWVRTDMGGPGAETAPEQAVAELRALFARLEPADSGKFLRRNGEEYPW